MGMCKHIEIGDSSDDLVLRVHNVLYMDGQEEMEWRYEDIVPYLHQLEEQYQIPWHRRLTNLMSFGAELRGINKKSIIQYIHADKTRLQYCPYAISFSHSSNDDRSWKEHGDQGNGVCLAFDEKELSRISTEHILLFSDIIYRNEDGTIASEYKPYILYLLKICYDIYLRQISKQSLPISINSDEMVICQEQTLFHMLLVLPSLIKPNKFDWECEHRLLVFCSENFEKNIHLNDNGKPYLELAIPFSSLKNVYLKSKKEYAIMTKWMSENKKLHALLSITTLL